MKRLLSMLLALFLSISNNVDYQVQGDVEYAAGTYYTIEEGQAPDYRNLYGSTAVASREVSCKPIPFKGTALPVIYDDNAQHINAYWFEGDVSKSYSELTVDENYTFEVTTQIIAPYSSVLLSSSQASDGQSMTVKCSVDGNDYQLQITGMDRWYCCMGRNENQKVTNTLGELVWKHTCSELQGTKFNQGQVLGKSIAGTTVIKVFNYTSSDKITPCSLTEFYNH